MEDNLMMPNEETLKKITGDIADEVPEATIRLAASLLVTAVEVQAIDHLATDSALKTLLNKNKQLGEAVVSFALAAVVELAPMPSLGDMRGRLAFNLRVQAYEELGKLVLRELVGLTPLIHRVEEEAAHAMHLANGGLTPPVQSASGGADHIDSGTGQP
jgi:hypothetical protein